MQDMIIRRSSDRFHTRIGWLDSRHTFSFADHYDPAHMGFRALRVINDDLIAAGQGFGTHPHRDMEIVSYVVEGALEHKDSMGTGSVIRAGDVQRMTAGTGVRHSEFNPSGTERTRLLQIWILPEREGLSPSYEERAFPRSAKTGRLCIIASPDGREGSVKIHQDVTVSASILTPVDRLTHEVRAGRHAWVQVVRGAVELGGERLEEGDGACTSKAQKLSLTAATPEAEFLLFDLN